MKKFCYKADISKLKVNDEQMKDAEKNQQKDLFESILNQGLTARFKDGVGGKKARDFAKVLDKLDACKDGFLLLEDSQFDILKEIFMDEQSRFLPSQTRLIEQYRFNCESAEEVK